MAHRQVDLRNPTTPRGSILAFADSSDRGVWISQRIHILSECHRDGAGALIQGVTVRFLHSALTPQILGFVPVVRRVVPSVGPAGALLS